MRQLRPQAPAMPPGATAPSIPPCQEAPATGSCGHSDRVVGLANPIHQHAAGGGEPQPQHRHGEDQRRGAAKQLHGVIDPAAQSLTSGGRVDVRCCAFCCASLSPAAWGHPLAGTGLGQTFLTTSCSAFTAIAPASWPPSPPTGQSNSCRFLNPYGREWRRSTGGLGPCAERRPSHLAC